MDCSRPVKGVEPAGISFVFLKLVIQQTINYYIASRSPKRGC